MSSPVCEIVRIIRVVTDHREKESSSVRGNGDEDEEEREIDVLEVEKGKRL